MAEVKQEANQVIVQKKVQDWPAGSSVCIANGLPPSATAVREFLDAICKDQPDRVSIISVTATITLDVKVQRLLP